MLRTTRQGLLAGIVTACLGQQVGASDLAAALGRNESRVFAAPFPLSLGHRVEELALPERLAALGYRRVHERPTLPGEFFWGHDRCWIFRRSCRWSGRDRPAQLIGLELDAGGRLAAARDGGGEVLDQQQLWLEPELLAETLQGGRAVRRPTHLAALPRYVWRAVLAAEDGRFFDHSGLDGRAIARAVLANLHAAGVAQGGSTITQQLIKNRDLTPQRSLRRKASEALRALALEASYSKEEILEAYLDTVYLGHREGLAIHGLATASETYFSRPPEGLTLGEAALMAAIIQSPNRLAPDRHPQEARERRDWVLGRLAELGWATSAEVALARTTPIRLRPSAPRAPQARHFSSWLAAIVAAECAADLAKGLGVVAESTLDAELQRRVEAAVASGINAVRRRVGGAVSAAMVVLDGENGDVLAHVGGSPSDPADQFDRARRARRQPGSTIKPLVMLEALESCGNQSPLHLASRVADQPLSIDQPGRIWSPRNADGRFRGVVTLRQTLVQSLNIPIVRVARWCGFQQVAARVERAGIELPAEPPPSFVLGAVEVAPIELASAYTVFAAGGRRWWPRPIRRLERPSGRRLRRWSNRSRRVSSPESAFLLLDVLREAVQSGTARSVQLGGLMIAAKTGTSSERRDAWLAGLVGRLVMVVWIGRDDGSPLSLPGSEAAAPIWRRVAEQLPRVRPMGEVKRPRHIVEAYVDPATGLRVHSRHDGARSELFRKGERSRRDHLWRRDRPEPVVR